MRSKIVPISNISRLADAASALIHRAPGMPGMGLIEGPTGYGKTTAVTWLIVQLGAVYVRAQSMTTPKSLLESICTELDVNPKPTNVGTVNVIVKALAESKRALFVDEADYLLGNKRLVETLRDIHDLSTMPVVLIGMQKFRSKISDLPQLSGRIAESVEFQAASFDDVTLLARHLLDVEVTPELLARLHEAALGSVRLTCIGLNKIEQIGRARGLAKVSAADWPAGAEFFVGKAPAAPVKRGALSAVK